jgi:hypothetical protein
MGDVDSLLTADFSLITTVDGGALLGRPSSVGHSVVVWASDSASVTLHDPGAGDGGRPDWKIPRDQFESAWSYLGSTQRELVAIG